jgi:hypothetical protein
MKKKVIFGLAVALLAVALLVWYAITQRQGVKFNFVILSLVALFLPFIFPLIPFLALLSLFLHYGFLFFF